ncbi:MAG: hypothetical protein ABIT16_12850 [Croceibacterium sp.]
MRFDKSLLSRRRLLAGLGIAGVGAITSLAGAATSDLFVEAHRASRRSDRSTIQNALDALSRAGGGKLLFEPGRTYDLGSFYTSEPILRVRDLTNAQLDGRGALLRCNTSAKAKPQIFLVQRCNGLDVTNFRGTDTGTNLMVDWQGMDFIHLETTAGLLSGIHLSNIEVDRANSLLTCSGSGDAPRARDITLQNAVARSCYYGLNFMENGDDVFGELTSINCRRTYFPYGVRRHQIALQISHDGIGPGADGCIVIARKERDTGQISVDARFSGVLAWSNLVHLVQQHPAGQTGHIEDIDLRLAIDPAIRDPNNAARLALSAYSGRLRLASSLDVWRNINLSGCLDMRGRSPVVMHTRTQLGAGVTVTGLIDQGCLA